MPAPVSTRALPSTQWNPYQSGLPTHSTILTLAADPRDSRHAFAGAYDTTGVYVSFDQARTWRAFADGLNGAPVFTLSFIGETFFAGTAAGLYRLRDLRWERVESVPAVNVNAITPSTDGTVFIATNERGVFASKDAGRSWTRLPGLGGEKILSLAAVDTDTLIVGTSGHGAFITRDSGTTWSASDSFAGEYVSLIVIDPLDGKIIYLSTRDGLYRSRDAGVTWQRVRGGIETEIVSALSFASGRVYAATIGRGVFVSDDNGSSWQNVSSGLPSGVTMLALAQLDAQTILVGAQNGVYLTRDAGNTWQSASAGLGVPQIHALALNSKANELYAATEDGLFRAQGENPFEQIGGDMLRDPTLSIVIAPSNPKVIYAGTYRRGIFVSRDGGDTWNSAGDIFQGRLSVPGLTIDPRNDQTIFARVLFERIYKSSDGGDIWHAVWTGMRDGDQVQTMITTPSDPTRMYAGTSDGVYFSQNSGESWQSAGLGELSVFTIWVDPRDPHAFMAGTTDGLYRRASENSSWNRSGLDGITVAEIARNASGDFFVGTKYNGVWISRDDARTWVRTGLDDASIIALVTDDARGVLYAATTRGLFRTSYP